MRSLACARGGCLRGGGRRRIGGTPRPRGNALEAPGDPFAHVQRAARPRRAANVEKHRGAFDPPTKPTHGCTFDPPCASRTAPEEREAASRAITNTKPKHGYTFDTPCASAPPQRARGGVAGRGGRRGSRGRPRSPAAAARRGRRGPRRWPAAAPRSPPSIGTGEEVCVCASVVAVMVVVVVAAVVGVAVVVVAGGFRRGLSRSRHGLPGRQRLAGAENKSSKRMSRPFGFVSC